MTFRAVAHQRSFSGAARALALSQPSVSNQVSALEREIGARLLERRPGGLRLTREGEILLEHADAIAERFGLADAQIADIAGERAELRIGAVPTALAGLVPAAVAELRRAHPNARVTIEEGTSAALPERVRSGALHLVVSFQDAGDPRHEPERLERRDLLHEPFLVALAPDHPLSDRRHIRLADLADADWTAASADGIIVRACRAAGFEPRLVSITRDQLAIRGLITRGLAVTITPALIADAFGDLALRTIDGPAPSRDVYALLPPGGRHRLAAPLLEALQTAARSVSRAAGTE